ncbi:MAG TPA: serine/threonine-protein kinase [Planctomycetota bacterium]
MHACPSDAELERLAGAPGALPPEVEAHLEACRACREGLAEARRDSALLAELRAAVRPAAGPPQIPGYRLGAELGRGGQGVVYRAEQLATGREVALKLLGGRTASTARERRRFEREIELGARLAHPGIVTVFDGGVSDGTPWCAMELVEGETLEAHLARTRPALARRLALFLELCTAVAHAHRSGVLHRDLKPSNVRVDAAGRVRVLDFGTALAFEGGATRRRLTAPGEFVGTLAYASPESIAEGSEACDARADVYSLGVVLYELVTGALPIDVRGSLAQVVARVTQAEPVPARRRVPGLARGLAAILARALAKEPARRYASVEALARDVEAFRAHRPLEARPAGPLAVLALALRRHWRAAGITAAVLVAGAFLAGDALRARLAAGRERDRAALVRTVFEDVLAAAAPQRMGGDAPLRDVLALAAAEIERELAGAPDVQAAVRFTIGDTYRRLLMPREAAEHLRAALARHREAGTDGLELARCLDALGAALSELGSAEAIPLQEEALALRRAELPAGDPLVAASQRALAVALLAQPRDVDVERARALLGAALESLERVHGAQHAEVAETELALWRVERGDGPADEARLLRALAILERPENARDPRRLVALTELSLLRQVQGRLDEAERLLARVEELAQELYGDELATDLLRRQANLRFARGDLRAAEELTRRALVAELRAWGRRRPDETATLADVAARLESAQWPASLPPYVEAFRHLRRFEGDGAYELAGWMNGIVVTLAPVGRHAESEVLLEEALNIRCRAWGSDCPIRQRTLELLAEARVAAGRAGEARSPLEESIAIAERRGEPGSAAHARALLAGTSEAERP